MAYKSQRKKKRVRPEKELTHVVSVRVDDETYKRLADLLPQTGGYKMSQLARAIIENKRIKIFTHDPSIDPVIQELGTIRQKVRITGLAINQFTKSFNTSDGIDQQQFFAGLAFSQYGKLAPEVDRLLEIVQSLAKRWLDEPPA